MCSRYVTVSNLETIQRKFNVTIPNNLNFEGSYNIGPGKQGLVITQELPHALQSFQYGFSPSWAKKQMYLFNARSEGDHNLDDNPNYSGGMGILQKPSFKVAIRSQRCLVVADCFYEGPKEERLSKPYIVYVRDRRPFAFAGIYNTWMNPDTKETVNTFAIVTTVANDLMHAIGCHRSPVILSPSDETRWLKGTLANATSLMYPYPAKLMNAYPVAATMKDPKAEGRALVEPIGQRIYEEADLKMTFKRSVQGPGSKKSPKSESEQAAEFENAKKKGWGQSPKLEP